MPDSIFPLDPVLTGIVIAYRDDSAIADQVLPRWTVGAPEFKYTVYDIPKSYTVPETRVPRKAQPNVVGLTGTDASGRCEPHGLDAVIDNQDIRTLRHGSQLESQHAALLARLMVLAREQRAAKLVFNPDSYASGLAGDLAGDKFDVPTSDPLGVLLAAKDKPLMTPNKMVIGHGAWSKLRRHKRLVQAIRGSESGEGAITPKELADLLELNQVLIGHSRANMARPGQAADLQRVWGDHIAMIYVDPQGLTPGAFSFGGTAQYGSKLAGVMDDPRAGLEGSRIVRAGEYVCEHVVAPHAGVLIRNVLTPAAP